MRAIHFILGLIFYSLVAAFALFLLFAARNIDFARQAVAILSGAPAFMWLLSGVALLALLFAFLLSGLRWRNKKELIMFENADGRIGVDVEAVKVYLDAVKDEFAAVLSMSSDLKVARGGLAIAIKMAVREGTQIPELCRLVQNRVKELLAEHLGSCDLLGIGVEVTEIRPGRG